MAASVLINELNGAGETATDKTSGTVRMKNADNATVDLNDPLVIPTSGREYSFEKILRLSASGEYTQISNLQIYTDGSPDFIAGSPTSVDIFYAIGGTYRAPVVPSEADAIPRSDIAGSPVENMSQLFALVSGSAGDMDATNTGPFTPLSPNADVQFIGDYLYLCMRVLPDATSGVTASETLTFSWDEI